METKQRSATQIFRQAQHGQMLEHVARIQELESQVAALQAELAAVRSGGGTDELQSLPSEALNTLLTVFDAVPIPDLSAWERRQALQKLSANLDALQRRDPTDGGLVHGTWSLAGDAHDLRVAEGDGATVARITREIVKSLGEVAGKYLAQMVEYQGTTPDHVARARATHLMDVSSLVDTKAQYGLLPAEGKRALFEEQADDLILAKDQLYAVTRWMNESRLLVSGVLQRLGLTAERGASLLGLVQVLAEHDGLERAASLREPVQALVSRYASLLPGAETLEVLGLQDSPFQRAYASAVSSESELTFLTDALTAVLDDHELAAKGLSKTAIDGRARKALAQLAKGHAASPAKARRALERAAERLAVVDEAQGREEAAQKTVVKRFARELERRARERFAASERPEASIAAFDRLTKTEKTAHLASVWLELVSGLRRALEDPEHGVDALAQRAAAAAEGLDVGRIQGRARELEQLAEALRNPPEDPDSLTLSTPIDVEEGLLAHQLEDLRGRIDELLGKYKQSKTSGMRTLEEAAETLAEIEAMKRGKKAALDKKLKKSHAGRHSAKRESAAAKELLAEQRELAADRSRIAARKAGAYGSVRVRLSAFGLAGETSYDSLWSRISAERERLEAARAAQGAVAAQEQAVRTAANRLCTEGVHSPADARTFLRSIEDEAQALERMATDVEIARAAYLELANRTLRKKVKESGAGRLALEEVRKALDVADQLRSAEKDYTSGFKQSFKGLSALGKVLAAVRKQRKRAEELQKKLEASAKEVTRAVSKLTAGE